MLLQNKGMVIVLDERQRTRLDGLGYSLGTELEFCDRLRTIESEGDGWKLQEYRDSGLLDDFTPYLQTLGEWVGVFARRYGRKLPAFAVYTVFELMKAGLTTECIEGYFSSQEKYRANGPFMRLLQKAIEEGSREHELVMNRSRL